MRNFLDELSVNFVEPTNIFEQLEERIVLNAAIAAIANQNVNQNQNIDVQPHPTDATATNTYQLTVDGHAMAPGQHSLSANGAPVDFNSTTGEIKWTPNNADVGAHTFQLISDDHGTGSAPNGPVSTPFSVTVNNVAPWFTGAATAQFTETNGTQTFQVHTNEDGQGVTYSISTYGSPSTPIPTWISMDGNGLISANPQDGQEGTFKFTITVNDGHTTVDQTPFTVTVANKLDFRSADNAVSTEDWGFGATGSATNVFDVNTDTELSGKPVTYSLVGAPAWLSINPTTGVMTGVPDNTMVNSAGGHYNFTIHADSSEGSADQAFQLTVVNNPSHFLNHETTISMTETSGVQTFDVQNDDEGVSKATTPYSFTSYDGGSVPSWLTIDAHTGLISGNPLNQDVGVHTVKVQFDDGNYDNGVQYQTFTLNVANIPNYFQSANATTWIEDHAGQTFDVQTHEENQLGAHITYSLADTHDPTKITDGGLTWDGWVHINPLTGVITTDTGKPDNSYVGDHTFTIVSDENNGAPLVTQDFTLTVVNTVPVIVSDDHVQVQEDSVGATFQVKLANNDSEPGSVWSIDHAPTIGGTQVYIDSNGLLHIPTGTNKDVGGIYDFNITVNDQHGGVATQFFSVELTNKAPVFTDLPPVDLVSGKPTLNVAEDSTATFDINTASPLNDEGDGPTHYYLVGSWSWISIDSTTGFLTVHPNNANVGDNTVTVGLDDGHGGVATQDIVVHVNNTPPAITTAGSATWIEDGGGTGAGYQSFDVHSTDDGQGTITYSASGQPSWLNFDANGHMWAVPANAQVGTWNFTVTVNDGHGGTDTQPFTLTVTNVLPVFDSAASVYFNVNYTTGVQTFDAHTTDENSDRNPSGNSSTTPAGNEYQLTQKDGGVSDLAHVSINSKTGIITWDGAGLAMGDHQFYIHFFDGTGWIQQPFDMYITNTPPSDADHDLGFFSANNARFLEDEPNQHFDVQYTGEGAANLVYQLDGSQPAGLTIDAATGVITWSPTNKDVTSPSPLPETPHAFGINVVDISDALHPVTVAHENFKLYVDNVQPYFTTPASSLTFTEDQAPAATYNVNNTDEGQGF